MRTCCRYTHNVYHRAHMGTSAMHPPSSAWPALACAVTALPQPPTVRSASRAHTSIQTQHPTRVHACYKMNAHPCQATM